MTVTVENEIVFNENRQYNLSANSSVFVKTGNDVVDVKHFSVERVPTLASPATPNIAPAPQESEPEPPPLPEKRLESLLKSLKKDLRALAKKHNEEWAMNQLVTEIEKLKADDKKVPQQQAAEILKKLKDSKSRFLSYGINLGLRKLLQDDKKAYERLLEDLSGDKERILPTQSDQATPKPPSVAVPSFMPLFNGEDLGGWKTHPDQPGIWRVENGILIGSGQSASYLFTERSDFKDFHLRAETRINAGGNSGLFFRSPFGPGQPQGYEADIADDPQNSARIGSLVHSGVGTLVEVRKSPVLPGRWFALEVLAKGNHIVIKVNGKTTADYIDRKNFFSSGHIALQQRTTQTVAEFRKIEIKELKSPRKTQ